MKKGKRVCMAYVLVWLNEEIGNVIIQEENKMWNQLLAEKAAKTAETAAPSGGAGTMVMLVYIAIIVVFGYFFLYRPNKKEKTRMAAMLSELEIGDTVLTTSGFYGEIIDITDDDVIVEFGNNKNCRIPMQKTAIVQVEKDSEE